MNLIKKIPSIYLLSIFFFLFLLSYNASPLYDQDEAAYAGFAKRMLQTGDWITQDFPFSEPHKKPPLHLWITAFSFSVFGISEFSLRIFPALWITLSCLMTYWIAKHIFDKKIAEISFVILASSIYFPLNGKIALVDGLLTFCQTLGLLALVKILLPKSESNFFWVCLFWLAIALGALTKGPPIFIFLGGICFVCLFFSITRTKVLKLKPWFFLPISILPLFYWGYLAWQKTNGEMIRWMIDWYILRRASDPVFGQSGPPGIYLVLFFLTLFPWSFFLPAVFKKIYLMILDLKNYLFKKTETITTENIFLLSSLFFGWVFYEFLMSKLPSYPLAAYPVFAILIAKCHSESQQILIKKIILMVAVLTTFVIHLFVAPLLNPYRADSQKIAFEWNQSISGDKPVYVLKNYAIPSLAFYLKNELIVLKDIQDYKNIPKDSYMLIDPETLMLLTHFGLKSKVIENERSIFAYDRNKSISLMIIKRGE